MTYLTDSDGRGCDKTKGNESVMEVSQRDQVNIIKFLICRSTCQLIRSGVCSRADAAHILDGRSSLCQKPTDQCRVLADFLLKAPELVLPVNITARPRLAESPTDEL